eukprot:scaffold9222_cov89-Cylindrotheca_fusiformis.AAC.1
MEFGRPRFHCNNIKILPKFGYLNMNVHPILKGTTTLYGGYWGYQTDIEQDFDRNSTQYDNATTTIGNSSSSIPTTTTTDNNNDNDFSIIRGVRIYPLVMAKTSQLAPGEASFF